MQAQHVKEHRAYIILIDKTLLTLFLTLKESKYYIMGLSFKAILFPDTYDTLLGNENIQTFLLIATYTSCEYTYGIFLS